MFAALRRPLPVAIRLNRSSLGASRLSASLAGIVGQPGAPEQLPWYPSGMGWHWPQLERKQIKKDEEHSDLKESLVQHQLQGRLARQEAVSMVPALLLGVEPRHHVLDMCAAPGMKSSQILDIMHCQEHDSSACPSGLLLAGELNRSRAQLAVTAVTQIGSPLGIMVSGCDARCFPELFLPATGVPSAADRETLQPLRFDRVLCDVPCSADGTLRKRPDLWSPWTVRTGLKLHAIQLAILRHGLELLKVGGRLVYSTCSLNPIENEAVVSAALREFAGSIDLVAPAPLDGLCSSPGLEDWLVPHPDLDGVYFEEPADVPEDLMGGVITRSMFPDAARPSNGGVCDSTSGDPCSSVGTASSRASYALRQHCLRFSPHVMDTGGFFAAVFEKKSDAVSRFDGDGGTTADSGTTVVARAIRQYVSMAELVETPPRQDTQASDVSADPNSDPSPSTSRGCGVGSDGLVSAGEWQGIVKFYGLDEAISHRVFTRLGPATKRQRLYLASSAAARLMQATSSQQLVATSVGVCILERSLGRHSGDCPWRLAQTGVRALCVEGVRRRLQVTSELFARLVSERRIPFADVLAAADRGMASGLDSILDEEDVGVTTTGNGRNQRRVRPGGVVVQAREVVDNEDVGSSVVVVAFVSDYVLETWVSASDSAALLFALGVDESSINAVA